jgi:hypothetical protein
MAARETPGRLKPAQEGAAICTALNLAKKWNFRDKKLSSNKILRISSNNLFLIFKTRFFLEKAIKFPFKW